MAFSQGQLDELQLLFRNLFTQGTASAHRDEGAGDRNDGRRKLHDKMFKEVGKFVGDEKTWKQWSFQFRVATKISCPKSLEFMDNVVLLKDSIVTEELVQLSSYTGDADAVIRSTELYDVLCLRCEGQALVVVQSIPNMDGFAAWQKLNKRYNNITTAKLMSKVIAVVAPPKVTDLRMMTKNVEDWEAKEIELKTETNETVPERFKMAILTTMCPASVQDWVFQQTVETTTYKELKDKIISIVENRVSLAEGGKTAMDIGAVQGRVQEEWYGDDHYAEDFEIGAVNANMQCHKCQGWGHFARECASAGKGIGKDSGKSGGKGYPGGKGGYSGKGGESGNYGKGDYGKSYGKGDYGKSYGKGSYGKGDYGKGEGKGKGKGYQGVCFKCNKVGHKAFECRSVNGVEEHQGQWEQENNHEEDVKAKEVSSVWMMALNVSKVSVEKKKMQQVKTWKKFDTRNSFEALNEQESNENDLRCETCFDLPPGLAGRKDSNPESPKGKIRKASINMVTVSRTPKTAEPIRKASINTVTASRTPKNANDKEVLNIARKTNLDDALCGIVFHATTARKMLVSVDRLAAAGNLVRFGPGADDNYIMNVKTSRKIWMRKNGGVYEVAVMFKVDEEWKEGIITIDSGAEECVMPKDWYKDVEMSEKKDGIKFMGADGSDLGNFGRKLMEFVPKEDFAGFTRRA